MPELPEIPELAGAIETQAGLDLLRRVESFLDGWNFEDREQQREAYHLLADVQTAIALCAPAIER